MEFTCMLCTRKTIGGGICQVCMEDLPKCQDIKQEPIEYLLYICASCCTHSYCHYSYYYCPACYITLDDEVPDLENLDQLPKKGYIQLDCCRYYNHNDWLLPLYHVSIFSTLKEDDSPDEWNGMEPHMKLLINVQWWLPQTQIGPRQLQSILFSNVCIIKE